MATRELLYMTCDRCGVALRETGTTTRPWLWNFGQDGDEAALHSNHRDLRKHAIQRKWRCTSIEDVCAVCVREESL